MDIPEVELSLDKLEERAQWIKENKGKSEESTAISAEEKRRQAQELQKALRKRGAAREMALLQFVRRYPDSPSAAEALYRAGRVTEQPMERQIRLFLLLLENYPFSPYAVEGFWELGRICFEGRRMPQALAAFRAHAMLGGSMAQTPHFAYRRMAALLACREYADLLEATDRFLLRFSDSEFLPEIGFWKIRALLALEEYEKAIANLEKGLQKTESREEKKRLLYLTGLCREMLSDQLEAARVYGRLLELEPEGQGDYARKARQRLDKMGHSLFVPRREAPGADRNDLPSSEPEGLPDMNRQAPVQEESGPPMPRYAPAQEKESF